MVDGDPSLHPPLHGNDSQPPETCSWVLLDVHAYVADRQNSTSASAVTSDGAHVVRVTFCAAPPPLVSYICVWASPGLSPNNKIKIVSEPIVEGAGSDLLLLEVYVRGRRDADFFVYKASAGRGGLPSLQLIHLPKPCLRVHYSIALLAHGATEPDINLEWNWEVSTWSRSVTELCEGDWHNDYNVRCPDISVDEDTENADLLPVFKDSQGATRPTLGNFYIAHPTLSLSDSHVVYVMAKVGRRDKKALVLSIDMKKPRLKGVAVFDAERMYGDQFVLVFFV